MATELAKRDSLALAPLERQAQDFRDASKADNTKRAYRADWADFLAWCQATGRQALPATAETLCLYLTDRAATCKVSTLQRRLSAISQAHQVAGHGTPTTHPGVRATWQGIRRVKGTAPEGKAPALTADVRAMVGTLFADLLGARDRALLLVGFAGAFRRSELVGLNREDVAIGLQGVTVTLRRSKTDQEGAGRQVGIPYGSRAATCPVRALTRWLEASGITEGPLFRSVNRHGQLQAGRLSDRAVALVVKRCAASAGLDAKRYAGHSLRAGLATSAAAAGVGEKAIMDQTGHRSVQMVRRYIRRGSLFQNNAAGMVGL